MTDDRGRNIAEWMTFAGSCLVLLLVIGLIVVQMRGPWTPPIPVATVSDEVRVEGARFYVDVAIDNRGDETASNVQVSAELTIDGDTSTADQTIDFLAGGESNDLVFVFDDDPTEGTLTISVTGYAAP